LSFVGSTLAAIAEPPPVEITFPSRLISLTSSEIAPEAAPTSGSCFTFVSTESGNAGGVAVSLLLFSKATLPLMTASAFWYELSSTLVKAALIVSVRT